MSPTVRGWRQLGSDRDPVGKKHRGDFSNLSHFASRLGRARPPMSGGKSGPKTVSRRRPRHHPASWIGSGEPRQGARAPGEWRSAMVFEEMKGNFCTGASRSNSPRSQSCRADVAVRDLVIEASRKRLCSLTATLFSRSAKPKPSAHSYSPFSTTATDRPGTWVEAMNLQTAASIFASLPAESLPF
jgi:hypothetical protein